MHAWSDYRLKSNSDYDDDLKLNLVVRYRNNLQIMYKIKISVNISLNEWLTYFELS
jgi:hypothetical protein